MKTIASLAPKTIWQTCLAFGGALNKRSIYLTIFCLITATLWRTQMVTAAPAKTESHDSTFPLDFQPPLFEATTASQPNGNYYATTTVDSYGNPIESLQPILTPDGRKVVSAQGVQFEIPNYASGITELTKPTDDLLPPFIAPFDPTNSAASITTTGSQNKVPLSADRESFPPFNKVITVSTTQSNKATFGKSQDGKVITNNIFLSGSTSTKPFGSTTAGTSSVKNNSATQAFTGFSKSTASPSVGNRSGATAATTGTATSTTFGSAGRGTKYTGGFGGPPGVLSPQGSGFAASSTTSVTKTFNKPAVTSASVTTSQGLTSHVPKFTGSFGGPPGILKPYDNVRKG